jgi:hypothetical protein
MNLIQTFAEMELGKLNNDFRIKYPKRKKTMGIALTSELIQQFDEHQRTYVKRRKDWQGRKKPTEEESAPTAEKIMQILVPLTSADIASREQEQVDLSEREVKKLDHDNSYYKLGNFPDGWFNQDLGTKRSFAKYYRYCVYCQESLEGKWHENHIETCEGPKEKKMLSFCEYCCCEYEVFGREPHRCRDRAQQDWIDEIERALS